MITQAHRQEALCRAYVQAVAAQAGLLWGKTEPDYGLDLSLRSVGIQENRRRDVGVQIDLQLITNIFSVGELTRLMQQA